MNEVKELIDKLVADLDERTRAALEGNAHETAIHLYGSRDSRYLKGVAAKAKKLWAPVRWFDCPPPLRPDEPLIVDRECFPDEDRVFIPCHDEIDLDCNYIDGLSCTAEACLYIMRAMGVLKGVDVCIIGRGHAVKGLADALVNQDATVTVCHSKTKNLLVSSMVSDIIINSAPGVDLCSVSIGPGDVILDISGSLSAWENSNLITYIGSQDIGRLNTSLVLNRFATR